MRIFSRIKELTVDANDTEMQMLYFEEVLSDSPNFPRADLAIVPNESEKGIVHEKLPNEKSGEEKLKQASSSERVRD